MFERFTEHARHVVELAKQEAQRFVNEYVGTEHLLWGLAKENHGVAAATLEHFNVNLKPFRKDVEALLESRPHVEVVEKLAQSPEVKAAIIFAIDEARTMHHNYVGTEHLLLGLLHDPETIAAQVLTSLGLKLDAARDVIRDLAAAQHAAAEQA